MANDVVSLFSGIGGFDLGFERAGFRVVAQVENDAKCRDLLRAGWPDVVYLDDVRAAGVHNLPACDVLTMGFPCQDLSISGRRTGLQGRRSALFYEGVRIIDELRPAFAVWENVPGLFSSDDGRDFARVLMALGDCGYSGSWRVLDGQWFGVAQRRRRVFGVFSRLDSGARRCAQVLSVRESMCRHPAPSREAGEGVAGSVESRTTGGGFPGTDGACAGHVIPVVSVTLGAHSGRNHVEQEHVPVVARTVSCNNAYASGRDKAMVQLKMQVRRLTPTECERLQGFPDGWTAGFSDLTRYSMLGNAVCVPVAQWMARRLKEVTDGE